MPDFVRALVERYKFEKYPKSFEDMDLSKGVEFFMGKSRSRAITKFTIFDTFLLLETRSNTTHSKEVLDEMLDWGAESFGLNFDAFSISRYAYISDVTFHSDEPLLSVHPAIVNLVAGTSQALSEIWQESVQYFPVSMKIGHDPTERKNLIAPFTIERRAETRFSENKYFSEAPLPTDLHWEFLEKFERDIALGLKVRQI